MAIQIDKRTKIIAGAGVLALVAAGAAAWFFLQEDPPPPVAKAPAPAKAATEPSKAAAEAPKPAADASRSTAQASKTGGDPIPAAPDKLIAELIEISGLRHQLQAIAQGAKESAANVAQSGSGATDAKQAANLAQLAERSFQFDDIVGEVSANLRKTDDVQRMGRFLELLRQPICLKMAAVETSKVSPEKKKEFLESFRSNPPPRARSKLIQTIDEIAGSSDLVAEIGVSIVRVGLGEVIESMEASGKLVTEGRRRQAEVYVSAFEKQVRTASHALMHLTYHDVSDQDLSEYVKLMDSETGRWGAQLLLNAIRPVLVDRTRVLAKHAAKIGIEQQAAAKVRTPPAAKQAAASQKPPACVIKPIMSEAEMAACR